MDNTEIQNVMQILGLQHGKVYDSLKSLRYGHLMIMTDQDHDGSHIKELLINFIHSFWLLIKMGGYCHFIQCLNMSHGRKVLSGNATGWSIKYYKGLGTSTSKEGKEYFKDLENHKKDCLGG